MRFDTVVVGGGLSGLACGISLLKAGQRVALVSAGQSTLHFHSGSFDLLGYDNEGQVVKNPLEAISRLKDGHPYTKIASTQVAAMAEEAKQLLAEAGIATTGDASRNHYRLSPIGAVKSTWLTIEDFVTMDDAAHFPWKRIAVANIIGYLDFPTKFLVAQLRKMGVEVDVKAFTTPELDYARRNPSEMRATNISRVLSDHRQIEAVAGEINEITRGYEAVLLPAVVSASDGENASMLKQLIKIPARYVATLPPSASGVRTELMLKRKFYELGGTYIINDEVVGGTIEGGRVTQVETSRLPDERIMAKNYVLATGSFMSHGLISNYDEVYEPIFHLDVDAAGEHSDWTHSDVFKAQPFMEFGLATDARFHAMKGGKPIDNLFAIGSILSGHNQLKLADGTGVDLLTALQVAKTIVNKEK